MPTLRKLQRGELIGMPHSRPMPGIGARCHELRVKDKEKDWRIVYRLDPDAIPIVEVFLKTTRQTPTHIIAACRKRFGAYDEKAKAAKRSRK